MSDAYDRRLVAAESTLFERVATATVGLAAVTLLVAVGVLFRFLAIDRPIAGLSLSRILGLAVLAESALVVGLGAASRLDLAETTPDRFSGPVIGATFGGLWVLAAGLVASNTLGLGALGWYVVAPVVGLAVAGVTMTTPEDVGTTVPVGALLGLAGIAVAGGLVHPGWTWSPATLSVTFPAHVVVPMLAIVASLLGGWTAGKAATGFGSRGRQYGAYLLITLVVAAVLAVLVVLVAFIAVRGLQPVMANLTLGAATGLLVALVPLVGLGLAAADRLDGPAPITSAGTLLRLLGAGVSGTVVVAFAVVLVAGRDVSVAGATVTPAGRIGTGIAILALVALTTIAWNRYRASRGRRVGGGVPATYRTAGIGAGLVFAAIAGVALVTDVADGVVGLVVVPVAAALAVATAAYPAVVAGRRVLDGRPDGTADARSDATADARSDGTADARPDGTADAVPVPELSAGVIGGLAFLGLAVALEGASGVVPVALPSIPLVGGIVTVAVAGQLVAAAYLVTAVLVVVAPAWRDAAGRTAQATLAVVSVLGALTLLVAHAIVTSNELVLAGEFLRITPFGALDWPFVMNPSQGLGIQRGIMPAILGTIWLVAGAVVIAVPLAVGAAVYLTEYAADSPITSAVEVATNGLWSTPSIVFGLFGFAFLVPRFGNSRSLFAGQLVLAFMLLPLVLITSREAMQSVPDEYRDASAALGVSRWETIRSVVIPAAMPGVITGVILGVGRIAGETAPLLLVFGGAIFPTGAPDVIGGFDVSVGVQPPFVHVTNDALLQAGSALPYQLYALIKAGVGGNEELAWGTALILLGVVLSFYAVGIASRRYFRRKLSQ